MNKKIAILFISLLLCAVFLCSCVHIADTNGEEDYSLGTLTEDDIINSNDFQAMGSLKEGIQGGVTRYTAKRLSGVYTVGNVYSKNSSCLTIRSTVTLESGNVRICLVQNGEIVCDIPVGENMETKIENPSGKYQLRVAGESASLVMEYSVS
jgi:hypothetical protein